MPDHVWVSKGSSSMTPTSLRPVMFFDRAMKRAAPHQSAAKGSEGNPCADDQTCYARRGGGWAASARVMLRHARAVLPPRDTSWVDCGSHRPVGGSDLAKRSPVPARDSRKTTNRRRGALSSVLRPLVTRLATGGMVLAYHGFRADDTPDPGSMHVSLASFTAAIRAV